MPEPMPHTREPGDAGAPAEPPPAEPPAAEPPVDSPPAAQDPADEQVDPGRGLRDAFTKPTVTKPTRGQLVVALLLALVGFAAITQVQSNEADDRYAGLREQDLIDVLNGLAGTTQRAQSEIARLEATRDDLLSDTNARQAALTQAQEQAAALAILAGRVPVTGPGIRVTIEEIEGRVRIDSMIDMVQELRTAGAEAMQINGQVRVVAQTSFEDTEGGVLVGGQLLSPPYVVDVIGDPDTLAGAITFRAGPSDQLEDAGAEVTVDELASLDIESVTDPDQPEFAQPDLSQ